MHNNTITLILLCLSVLPLFQEVSAREVSTPPATNALGVLVEEAYQLGTGDVLILSVWRDDALSRTVTVLPDGTISLPLIGQLTASGRTIADLEREVSERIKQYLPEPVFDISVGEVNSMMIYVLGKVRSPGRFPVKANINVLQALAMAGGLDKFAKGDSIKVYRGMAGTTTIFNFDYEEVTEGKELEQNIKLKRGDVVVIP